MLCKTCENLPLPTNVAGSCKVSKCTNVTSYFAYPLCSDCSEELNQCERCETPLTGLAGSSGGVASVFHIKLTDKDAGKSYPGMKPGEQIIVVLEEDQYSQTQWGHKRPNGKSIFKLSMDNGFTPDPGQWQKGTRELVFDIVGTGTETLELEEKVRQRSHWYGSPSSSGPTGPAPNGKTWQVQIQSN